MRTSKYKYVRIGSILTIGVFSLIALLNWKSFSEQLPGSDKQAIVKGFSFVGASYKMDRKEIDTLKSFGCNWVCFMPYSYVNSKDKTLKRTLNQQWWGESYTGIKQSILWSNSNKLRVMVKPHLWFMDKTFNGDFKCNTEKEWLQFESDYEKYILEYAKLSDSLKVELFCLGVELKTFVKERPAFWNELISKVRTVYKGKLTYAANWDNYKRIPFWNQLDYIGIDAYFPGVSSPTPDIKELETSFKNQADTLTSFFKQQKKPILFTEFGFRSKRKCCHQPWIHDTKATTSYECQSNAFKAFYNVYPKYEWFQGGFIWKWFASKHYKEEDNTGFSPQNKPAIKLIKEEFNK